MRSGLIRAMPSPAGLRRLWLVVLVTVPCLAAATPPRPSQPVVFPEGTVVPIRFLHSLTGGLDRPGTSVLVQTLGALAKSGCVVVEPFTLIQGHIVVSRAGGRFGRSGELSVAFDSIEIASGAWAPLTAALDSLEYASPSELKDSGAFYAGHARVRSNIVRASAIAGVGAITEIGVIPVALLAGWGMARTGPRARILAGEVASLRLREPLRVLFAGSCVSAQAHPDLSELPALPHFLPRTTDDRHGKHPGDPVNLLVLGSGASLDSAFRTAGWVRAQNPGFRSLARGVMAALVARSAVGAPVSTQYFEGRKQDLAYELSGPNARLRHHIRLWLLDAPTQTWVAAADQDVGLVVNPFRRRATHRIAPGVDAERDLIVRVLEAAGCADLLTYLDLPGAVTEGRNASRQRFTTDGRAAVVRLRDRCE